MPRSARKAAANSKVSVKEPTALPRAVLLDEAPTNEADDPFAAFSEWSGEADKKAYADFPPAGQGQKS